MNPFKPAGLSLTASPTPDITPLSSDDPRVPDPGGRRRPRRAADHARPAAPRGPRARAGVERDRRARAAGQRAGRWALALPRALRELGATPSFTLAATAAGDTVAVWWRGQLLYAVACADRLSVAAIIGHHLDGEGA